MIRFDSEKGSLEISGNVMELSTEALALVRSIYRSIGEKNEQAAEVYKNFFEEMIESAFMSSEELDKKAEEMEKRNFEMMNSLEELLNGLKEKMEHMKNKSNKSKNSSDTLHDEFERFLHGEESD